MFSFIQKPLGTEAAGYRDAVPMEVRKERSRVLRELAAEKNRRFRWRV